ncbi:MAG: hypothetical protein AABZ30_11320, partial [Myxococcota bacterium]
MIMIGQQALGFADGPVRLGGIEGAVPLDVGFHALDLGILESTQAFQRHVVRGFVPLLIQPAKLAVESANLVGRIYGKRDHIFRQVAQETQLLQ